MIFNKEGVLVYKVWKNLINTMKWSLIMLNVFFLFNSNSLFTLYDWIFICHCNELLSIIFLRIFKEKLHGANGYSDDWYSVNSCFSFPRLLIWIVSHLSFVSIIPMAGLSKVISHKAMYIGFYFYYRFYPRFFLAFVLKSLLSAEILAFPGCQARNLN